MPELAHEEAVAKCLEFDATPSKVLYILTTDKTFRMVFTALQWGCLVENEKYCLVKNQSYFLSEAAAVAARDRALAQ